MHLFQYGRLDMICKNKYMRLRNFQQHYMTFFITLVIDTLKVRTLCPVLASNEVNLLRYFTSVKKPVFTCNEVNF